MIVIISTVYQKSKHMGYRIYDTANGDLEDITYASMQRYLSTGGKVANASIGPSGRISGVNCALGDLPKINLDAKIGSAGYVDKPNALILVERSRANSYICVNYGGRRVNLAESNLNDYRSLLVNTEPFINNFRPAQRQVTSQTRPNQAVNPAVRPVVPPAAKPGVAPVKPGAIPAVKQQASTQSIVQSQNIPVGPKRNLQGESVSQHLDRDEIASTYEKALKDRYESDFVAQEMANKKSSNVAKTFEVIDDRNTVSVSNGTIRYGSEVQMPVFELQTMDQLLDIMKDSRSGMTVNQKVARACIALQRIDPLSFSIYRSLETVFVEKNPQIDTAAVSTDKIYFCCDWLKDMLMPELMFVILHEMGHIIYKTHSRGKNRNRDVFNIASDLYINKWISDTYKCPPNAGIVIPENDIYRVGICFPTVGLYSPEIDIEKDTTEGIYEEIMSAIEEQQKKQKDQADEGNKGGNSGNASGGHSKDSDSKNKDKNKQAGGGAGGQSANDDRDGNGKNQTNQTTDQIEVNGKSVNVGDIIFRGKKLNVGTLQKDVVLSDADNGLDEGQLEDKANRILQRAVMQCKMAGQHIDGAIERYIELELAPKIKWTRLLKAYLVTATSKITTYAKPDKRFISRGMTLPGPKALDPDKITGIKICVDTSGSISDKDIGIALAQCDQILRTYKADAELIYWDTAVRSTGKFSSRKDMLKIGVKGGGGTDINCVFAYFDTKECRVKPNVVVVFTDGYFGTLEPKYVNKYNKNTIWVVPEQDRTLFNPPNGKLAIF